MDLFVFIYLLSIISSDEEPTNEKPTKEEEHPKGWYTLGFSVGGNKSSHIFEKRDIFIIMLVSFKMCVFIGIDEASESEEESEEEKQNEDEAKEEEEEEEGKKTPVQTEKKKKKGTCFMKIVLFLFSALEL